MIHCTLVLFNPICTMCVNCYGLKNITTLNIAKPFF
uniref:Uncharacterized protein n=1 Tax=Anguilla anguilla TaxID=7936 RepID=A0A0E9UBA9_ANGAN